MIRAVSLCLISRALRARVTLNLRVLFVLRRSPVSLPRPAYVGQPHPAEGVVPHGG